MKIINEKNPAPIAAKQQSLDDISTLGERVKFIRKSNKLTQRQFADRILVTQSYLSRIENGKEMPNDKLTKLIALEFNFSIDWLKTGKEE